MFLEKLEHIKIEEKKYPLFCSINVLAEIQEKYETLDNWINIIAAENVNLKDLRWALKMIVNEGISVTNSESEIKLKAITTLEAGRMITSLGISKTAELIMENFIENIRGNDEKNL